MSKGSLRLFSGSASLPLAEEIAALLDVPLGKATTTHLPDSEIHVCIDEVVRGQDIFFIQSCPSPVNDNLMEALLYLDAFRRASVNSITVILPYFPYARQERMSKGREAISARVVATLLERMGASRVIYVDIHSPATQGFFNIPVDSLSAIPTLAEHFRRPEFKDCVVVSPDLGRAKLAGKFAEMIGLPLAILHKRRESFSTTKTTHLVGNVKGLRPIITDDIMAGGSVLKQLDALYDQGAEGRAYFAVTHPVLLPSALKTLAEEERIEKLVVSNTLPVPPEKLIPKIEVLSIAPLLAKVIRRIYWSESISDLMVMC